MTDEKDTVDFEARLQELEALVENLEDGDLSLEDSLQAFEHGVRLTRECQQALSKAEQRVQLLLEEGGRLSPRPLEGELDNDTADSDQ